MAGPNRPLPLPLIGQGSFRTMGGRKIHRAVSCLLEVGYHERAAVGPRTTSAPFYASPALSFPTHRIDDRAFFLSPSFPCSIHSGNSPPFARPLSKAVAAVPGEGPCHQPPVVAPSSSSRRTGRRRPLSLSLPPLSS